MTDKKFVVEYCSECEHENEFRWDVETFGYQAYCPHCGAVLMLCDECRHSENTPLKCIDVTTPIFECARTEEWERRHKNEPDQAAKSIYPKKS